MGEFCLGYVNLSSAKSFQHEGVDTHVEELTPENNNQTHDTGFSRNGKEYMRIVFTKL